MMTGCVNADNTAGCDDEDACTTDDTCASGSCEPGPPPNCDDGNPCTDDSCSPATGCTHVFNTASCEDGDKCTAGDVCENGGCEPGGAAECGDEDACTNDGCDPASGCTHDAVDCGDENECTTDGCDEASGCTYTPALGAECCTSKADCDDSNPCTADTCDLATYRCGHDAAPMEDESCDFDSDGCTAGDACESGTCVAGAAPDCDDSEPCTDDRCVSLGAQVFKCENPVRAGSIRRNPCPMNADALASFAARAVVGRAQHGQHLPELHARQSNGGRGVAGCRERKNTPAAV